MNFANMKDLYIDQLRDLYSAENQLLDALPKMAQAASSSELKQAFQDHLEETRGHKQRLEQVFSSLDISPQGQKCEAMEGLIQESDEIIRATGDPTVKDAALIAAACRVEHYEMAGYGSVRTFADELGYGEAKSLLQETLNEEGDADDKLTAIATGGLLSTGINEQAVSG